MIERKYLIDINKQQDSIINLKNNYIAEQNKIIHDLKNKVVDLNKVNANLVDNIHKQTKLNNIATWGSCSIILGIIISIFVK